MWLGGLDLDKVIFEKCEQKIQGLLTRRGRGAPAGNEKLSAQLREKVRRMLQIPCEQAKKELSVQYNATIKVDNLVSDDADFEDLDFEMEITRDEYEDGAMGVFEKLKIPIEQALEEAEVDADEIDEVVLAGGSSQTPYIKKFLK